jgi:pimeloyl-ACP methyl ester carboxylesterase
MTKYIIVILHGYDCKLSKYHSICSVVKESYPSATIILNDLGMSTFSVANPDEIVAAALKSIDTAWEQQSAMDGFTNCRIIIIGHSTGALLARKLYVVACGENENAPLEEVYDQTAKQTRPWAQHVERIILFAGMNRGWTLNHHLYNSTAIMMRIGIMIGHIIKLFGFVPLAFKTRKGASFITQLRIQWLSMLRHSENKKVGNALTIQLLGTIDDVISPEDNIDLFTGSKFIYLEVPVSDHMSILKMNDPKYGKDRKEIFKSALLKSGDELSQMQIATTDQNSVPVDEKVTDVVFVIHGIRDTGYWTQKIARRVKSIGDKAGRKFATETSTYGYFSMLPFLLPYVRRQKVEWLMDQYTENLAQYPNAEFSFMGHSNGTYLLAKALREYPACRFKNVVLAGSVVHQKYNWDKMIREGRVSKVFNFVATSDWVVAIFPKSFQALRIQDLGSGGYDGFSSITDNEQLKFVKGSHGELTKEIYWNEIANFIVHGSFQDPIPSVGSRSRMMKVVGAAAPVPFVAILAIVYLIAILVWRISDNPVISALWLGAYFLLLWKIVTRV